MDEVSAGDTLLMNSMPTGTHVDQMATAMKRCLFENHSETVVGRNGETIGEICNKFFAAREGVSTENRQRIMRFIENLCLGAAAVGYRTESMHGAGSPQAQRIMIARQGNIQGKKQLAKDIAGIVD